jgi:hypothetical protein
MKKFVCTVMACFCFGLFGLQAKTEFKQGFNDYNSAGENYSATKSFGANNSFDNDDEGSLRGGGPLPSDPGMPLGTGLGILCLCSGVYYLIQSRKKNEKTV